MLHPMPSFGSFAILLALALCVYTLFSGAISLRALAVGLGQARQGIAGAVPRYSATGALARNLALYPVILGHGFRRLVPF